MIDDQIAFEFYEGVPCGGVNKTINVEFKAPKKPGLYLVEQCIDLQYSMRDARQNALGRDRAGNEDSFIAWVEV